MYTCTTVLVLPPLCDGCIDKFHSVVQIFIRRSVQSKAVVINAVNEVKGHKSIVHDKSTAQY